MNKKTSFIKAAFIFAMALTMTTAAYAVDACKDQEMGHVGEGTIVEGDAKGSITDIPWGFQQWSQNESSYMTYYSNGTYQAIWSNAVDYMAMVGFFYDETGIDYTEKNYAVDYKYSKTGSAPYGYIGAYGWTTNPLVEFYIIDDWYSKPSEQYIGEKFGEIIVDGAKYTIHAYLRQQEPIDFDPSNKQTYVQIVSVRDSARQCGHINISAHLKKWNELFTGQTKQLRGSKGGGSASLKLGKITKVLFMTEAGGNATGSIDFTYFNMEENASSNSEVIESSSSSEEESSSSEKSSSSVTLPPYVLVDACQDDVNMGHPGEGNIIEKNRIGSIKNTPWRFEQWYDGGDAAMTVYDNGTFKSELDEAADYIARVGFRYDSTGIDHTTKAFAADYKYTRSGKAGNNNYLGAYGWTTKPQVEFYIVDDWWDGPRPNELYVGEKFGEIEVDGAKYSIHAFLRQQEPSTTGTSTFMQIFSIRETPRKCGHIDISAHFKKWNELFTGQEKILRGSKGGGKAELKFGRPTEISIMAEAGHCKECSIDYTYLNIVDNAYSSSEAIESSSSEVESSSSEEAKSSSSKVQESSSSEEESSSSESIKSSSSDEPESSSSAEESSSSAAESSSSEEEYTTTLSANIHLNNTDKNLQIFDMQGRFLGTTLFTRETDMQATVKTLVQRSGNYIVRQNGYVYKISVK